MGPHAAWLLLLVPLLQDPPRPADQDAVADGVERPVAPEARPVEDGLAITFDGAPFTTLHLRDVRVPHLYPVHAPNGARVTRGFPMDPRPGEAHDHPHHQSCWTAHGDVDGVDFWHDPGARLVLRGEPVLATDRDAGELHVTCTLDWTAPDGELHLVEQRTFTFRADATSRTLDVRHRFTNPRALPTTFGDTKEGFFALRLAPELRLEGERARGRMRNAEGTEGKACWGRRSAWLHVSGTLGPDPAADGTTAEPLPVAITVHDALADVHPPTFWHARPYGLVAANPFGAHDFEGAPEHAGDRVLAPGEGLELNYRVRIELGAPDDEALALESSRFLRDLGRRAARER